MPAPEDLLWLPLGSTYLVKMLIVSDQEINALLVQSRGSFADTDCPNVRSLKVKPEFLSEQARNYFLDKNLPGCSHYEFTTDHEKHD